MVRSETQSCEGEELGLMPIDQSGESQGSGEMTMNPLPTERYLLFLFFCFDHFFLSWNVSSLNQTEREKNKQ